LQIQSTTISGFRCFGPEPQQINFADGLTAIVGPNAAGKTAVLQALVKLFGGTRAQRTIYRADFHLPVGMAPDDRSPRDLFIDVVISLPELAAGKATSKSVAPVFKHMQVSKPKAEPLCRLRLVARWEDDGTAEGEVTQELYWVHTLDAKVGDDDKHKVAATDRGLIQVYYTPASRDAAAQIRSTTGALAARLLRAIEWSKSTRDTVDEATASLSTAFGAEAAIAAMSSALSDRWSELDDDISDADPKMTLIGQRFEEIVAKVQVLFQYEPGSIERGLDVLSDGQQSLFYFALAAAVFDVERQALEKKIDGFRADELRVPALTMLAIEEPENHLSPYFLSRIIEQVRSLVGTGFAQALVTSHSPAVLGRVEPTEVRYCRRDPKTRTASLKAVTLPKGSEEAVKFIRGAMLAFPELYFARFVLLVEGDSERIVLPKLAEADGLLVDPSFVAIVPLGGRHAQHFWRLLNGLEIPYATLLDLDLGRIGGGFGRIKTAIANLLELGIPREELLKLDGGSILSQEAFDDMHNWDKWEYLDGWISRLKGFGIFFSDPLDLDMAMLAAYPEAYAKVVPTGGGPKMKNEDAAKVILGEGGPGLKAYEAPRASFMNHMASYRYHFLTHSKPATHLQAFTYLDEETIETKMPPIYREIIQHITNNLKRD